MSSGPTPATMWVMPIGSEPIGRDDDGNLAYTIDDGVGTSPPLDVTVDFNPDEVDDA